jgi:hypothetical protein
LKWWFSSHRFDTWLGAVVIIGFFVAFALDAKFRAQARVPLAVIVTGSLIVGLVIRMRMRRSR